MYRFIALVYATTYGAAEALMLPIRAPSSQWQVPARWVGGRPRFRQELIWAAILGPGLITRNPYASYWLPVALLGIAFHPLSGAVVGALVGAAHGTARAAGIFRNMAHRRSHSHFVVMTKGIRWRCVDGVFLTFAAALLVAGL